MKTCSKFVDSAGAVRWLKQAERLARSIRQKYGVKRQIIDGYEVKGSAARDNLRASVMDLPGRLAVFGPVAATLTQRDPGALGQWATAPLRNAFLEATEALGEDARAGTSTLTPHEVRALPVGPSPQEPLSLVGNGPPTSCGTGVFQVSVWCPQSDGELPTTAGGVDYSAVSTFWIVVEHFPFGGMPQCNFLLHESVLGGLLVGRRVRSSYWNASVANTLCATQAGNGDVLICANISDGDDTAALSLVLLRLRYDPEEGGWKVTRRIIPTTENPHPAFVSGSASTATVAMRSLAGGATSVLILESVWSSHSGRMTLPVSGEQEAGFVFSARRVLNINLEDLSGSPVIDLIDTSVAREVVDDGQPVATAGALVTAEGLVVSEQVSSPDWLHPEWVQYVAAAYLEGKYHTVTMQQLGTRGVRRKGAGDPIARWTPESGTGDTPNTYRSTTTRVLLDVDGVVSVYEGSLIAGAPFVAPGGNQHISSVSGGVDAFPCTPIGLGAVEFPAVLVGSGGAAAGRVVARAGPGGVSVVALNPPMPGVAVALPMSTLVTPARMEGETYIPHRSIISYAYQRTNEAIVELRVGDVTTQRLELAAERNNGVFYMGNPFQSLPAWLSSGAGDA